MRGHLAANLDPLGIENKGLHPELDPATYGFTEKDYDRPIFIDGTLGLQAASLREILALLKKTYAGNMGVEFMHIQNPEKKLWIQKKLENSTHHFSKKVKEDILQTLLKAESFEKYLAVKYPGAKRFGLEGGESTVPALVALLRVSANQGVKEVVLGMAHRGRLNVLANIMGKPYRAIFSEFQGQSAHPEDVQGSGDVKYHLGVSSDQEFDGKMMHLSLTANPSHLEAVNPVVVGKVRAKQALLHDTEHAKVLGILLHGDAAFIGQGLVSETLLLSQLQGYKTGGTFHVVINNQIGFTTSPIYSRSSAYCSDVVKAIQAPVFHVNGDDPEAVVWAAQIAAEYRHTFKEDVVLDIFCYRRHGHNEMDEPSFTQPLMYKAIRAHKLASDLYGARLVASGVMTQDEVKAIQNEIQGHLEKEFEFSKSYKSEKADWLEGAWANINVASDTNRDVETGVDEKTLQEIGEALTSVPDDFSLHPKLKRLLDAKKKMFETGEGFDWSTAEALAFGSLLKEDKLVRLSGQDSGRGTFSQRHAVFTDQENASRHVLLNHIKGAPKKLEVIDSPLAEASVLGFELGYTLTDPEALVMWEAQFGDFSNGAQLIIDQFISSGEAKWLRDVGAGYAASPWI